MQKNRFLVQFLPLIIIVFLMSCTDRPKVERGEITVSILPYKYFAEQLTGGAVKVNCMLSPGDNHATYQPTPDKIEGLERSVAYFTNGFLVFEEAWLPNIKRNNPDLKIVDCSNGIRILSGHHHEEDGAHTDHSSCSHGGDPHYWTLPANAKLIVTNMYEFLSTGNLIPKDSLDANYNKTLSILDKLIIEMDSALSSTKRRQFLIYHPALSYISNQYELEQIAIEQEGKSPSVGQLKGVLDYATEKGMKHVLIQTQFDKENASLIAREIEGQVLTINPLDYDYFKSTLDLSRKLQKALND